MSLLTNAGFDAAIASAVKPLVALLKSRREAGLAFIAKALQTANLANLDSDQLASLAYDLQRQLVATKTDASRVSAVVGERMGDIASNARKEAVVAWGLSAQKELDPADKRNALLTTNTAGLFLMERDRALSIRVSQRFAAAMESDRGKVGKAASKFDPYTFFSMPWGEKAEQQYWTLVCGAWLGKARNHSIAESFSDSGMEWCRIAAEIDERTTHTCRFLHMKRILVSSAKADTANLIAPNTTSNWIAEVPPPPIGGLAADTQKPILLLPPDTPGSKPRPLAQRTEEHTVGTAQFDMGKYEQFVSDEELAKTLGPPPYHFLCRTLLVPDDYKDPLGLLADVAQKPVPTGLDNLINSYL